MKFSFIYERNSINKCYIFFIYLTEVKSLWSLYVGLHTCYKGRNKESLKSNLKLISKNCLSPDCSLKLENMKSKSLVIVNSMLRWINSQILHTPPITLEKLLSLEDKLIFSFIFIILLIGLSVIWVKLTQGTGRGTCWWSIFIFLPFKCLNYYFLVHLMYICIAF